MSRTRKAPSKTSKERTLSKSLHERTQPKLDASKAEVQREEVGESHIQSKIATCPKAEQDSEVLSSQAQKADSSKEATGENGLATGLQQTEPQVLRPAKRREPTVDPCKVPESISKRPRGQGVLNFSVASAASESERAPSIRETLHNPSGESNCKESDNVSEGLTAGPRPVAGPDELGAGASPTQPEMNHEQGSIPEENHRETDAKMEQGQQATLLHKV